MRNKILTLTLAGLLCSSFIAEADFGRFKKGVSVYPGTPIEQHIFSESLCNNYAGIVSGVPGADLVSDNMIFTLWGDPGMWVATGIDILATNQNRTKTVKAKKAIKKLKEALEGGGGCNGGADSTATDALTAETYTPETVSVVIELTEKKSEDLFRSVREEVTRYLTSTPDADVKGSCVNKDSDCALNRRNEWMVASVTLASATADKILETTVKSGGQSQTKTSGQTTTTTGSTPLVAHFQKLAADFNRQTVPTGMYDAMATIVLDTQRQLNEANALLGRDLEAQGLRSVIGTDAKNLNETEG